MPGVDKTVNSATDYPDPYLYTIGLSGVKGIKAWVSAVVSSSGGPSNDSSGNYIYEVQAWGVAYADIGLRFYDNGSVQQIGTETLNNHKLRIRKGSTTYGIPLVATNDVNASTIRIYDGSAVKSLPKVNTYTNFVNWADTTHTYSYTGGHAPTNTAYGIDENFATAHLQDNTNGGGTITSQHIFATTHDITKLGFRLYSWGHAYGDSGASVDLAIKIYTTVNGTDWTERYSRVA